MRTEVAF